MEILIFILAIGVMLIGLLGTIVPIVPGLPLIAVAAIGYALLSDRLAVDSTTIISVTLLALASLILDWVTTALGVKRYGGTWVTMMGALIGMVIGALLLQIIGIFLGAFLGAFGAELAQGRQADAARRAGVGAMLGVVVGTGMKIVIGVVMIGIFIWGVWR